MFCVKTSSENRNGYFLLRWSVGEGGVHIIKGTNHHDRFYNIERVNADATLHTITSRKNNGRVTRPLRWKFTGERLREDDLQIPVLQIIPMNTLPSMKERMFIPIVQGQGPVPAVPAGQDPVPVTGPPAGQAPVQHEPVVQLHAPAINALIRIFTIPQHIIRAVLRDAVMQGETCPITSEEIDVSNGAITSCFHLFEKNAIAKWLLMPNSMNKCPLCNTRCRSFTLD